MTRRGLLLPVAAASAVLFAGAVIARAQRSPAPTPTPQPDEIYTSVTAPSARRLALAVPELLTTGTAAVATSVAGPFTATLRADIEYSDVFVVADPALYPPGSRDPSTKEAADPWLAGGGEFLVDARAEVAGEHLSVEARVWDLKSRKMILGRRYSGGASYAARIAHTLANDLVKYFTGKNGPFLSTIVFVSDRERGGKEIFAMDFDGRNVRRLTSHRSISISPEARGGKIVYTSYVRLFPALWIMNADGSDKKEVPTGVELNASPSISPDGTQIVFAGSARGNTDIYAVHAGGTGLRRLTNTRSLEASPEWSPTGRQILYTSDQTGTPQIWMMEAEGTSPRRVTYAGNWNDEGAWAPDGSRIAFACRNEGDFNICVSDVASGRTLQLTGEGSNGHPSWSPDGQRIVYHSRRGSATQVYTMDSADGKNKRLLTDAGSNAQPIWMP